MRWPELDEASRSLLDEAALRQPLRVVVDSRNRVTPQHKLITQPGETWLMRAAPDEQPWPESVTQIAVPRRGEQLDLVALMMLLGKRQVNSLWVEAGASLAGALLQAGVVDELIVYLAPTLLGDAARGLCQLPGLQRLADAPAFSFCDVRQVGPDLRLTLTPR